MPSLYDEPQSRDDLERVAHTVDEAPRIFDYGQMLEWLLDTYDEVDYRTFFSTSVTLGRNYAPALVVDLWREGALSGNALCMALATAWQDAEFPLELVDEDLWRTLFDEAGYLLDGVPAPRPTSPLRLFRGARPEHRTRWSWTPDHDLAHWFANRPHSTGHVWEVTAPPSAMLATFSGGENPEFRGETEVVVDTRGLSVETHDCTCLPTIRSMP